MAEIHEIYTNPNFGTKYSLELWELFAVKSKQLEEVEAQIEVFNQITIPVQKSSLR